MTTFYLFLQLIPYITAQPAVYTIEVTMAKQELLYNNHVGNEWDFGIEWDKQVYGPQQVFYVTALEKFKLRVFVQEVDKYTDEVSHWIEIDPGTIDQSKVYTRELEFVIRENMGRYAGNTAKWKVTISYKLVPERT